MSNNSGGAAMNAGADFQQRVAAYFLLQMALGKDCSETLQSVDCEKIVVKVAFETDDAVDDIVLTHSESKTYLQAKRKLSLSDADGSDFLKTIEQFVRQSKASQNSKDSYAVITSNDTSLPIKKQLKKILDSARLNSNSISQDPMSSAELAAYGKLKRCIEKSYLKNGLGSPSKKDIQRLLKQTYIIVLDIEKDGINEKSFLESLLNKFSVEPKVIWNLIIAQALDWAKNRQSVDNDGIVNLLSKFRVDEPEARNEDLDNFFKVKFDLDNYSICSGRELVIMESPSPDHDYQLVELKRFDDEGNYRVSFRDSNIVMSNGDEFELLGRFSTFMGAKRFIEKSPDLFNNLLIIPIESDDSCEFDNTPIAKAYSEKVRSYLLKSNSPTSCIHCQKGISFPAVLVEVQEEDLPYDVGNAHPDCVRVSDRILGRVENKGVRDNPEVNNFDFNKWLSLLDRSQGIWAGIKVNSVTQPLKSILWNGNAKVTPNGPYCIKVKLKNGDSRYVQHRGKVDRYSKLAAESVCADLENWRLEAKSSDSPLCYSADGGIQGMEEALQASSTNPLELIECKSFKVAKFTRGIGLKYDSLNNFYAPLILLTDIESDGVLIFKNSIFLLTEPSSIKTYLDNWKKIGFEPESYRLDIIETDNEFDKLMHWAFREELNVFVEPFFDNSGNIQKGYRVESLEALKQQHENT